MGCDIHCYPEYRNPGAVGWMGFGHNLNPGRDYAMFAAMAGVRNYGDEPVEPVVEPRGFPEDASWRPKSDNTLWVSDTSPDDDSNCSREQAESWVASGSSRWVGDDQKRVSHPDWHSHSWLSREEFVRAMTARNERFSTYGLGPDYHALAAMLAAYEAEGLEARLVFWFDN